MKVDVDVGVYVFVDVAVLVGVALFVGVGVFVAIAISVGVDVFVEVAVAVVTGRSYVMINCGRFAATALPL